MTSPGMLGIRQSTLWIQQLDTGSMAVEWLNGSWNIFDSLGISRYINILLKIPREEDTHRIFFGVDVAFFSQESRPNGVIQMQLGRGANTSGR